MTVGGLGHWPPVRGAAERGEAQGAPLVQRPLAALSASGGRRGVPRRIMERLWNVMKKGLLAGDTLR
jgi:hypothetical protein